MYVKPGPDSTSSRNASPSRTTSVESSVAATVAVRGTRDGFALAEADFQLRREGDVLGLEQSGLPRLRVASLQVAEHRELAVVAVDRESGKILQDRVLFRVEKPQFAHKFNTYASPTPAIESGRVYVTFGSPGIACLDTRTGKTLWERTDFVCNHFRGAGSSPILDADRLYLNFDGSDRQ